MGGGTWYTEEQLAWMEEQSERFTEAQRSKVEGGNRVSKIHLVLQGEFFAQWPTPSEEAKGEYKQPKRVRKDQAARPRKAYKDSDHDQWVVDRRKQLTDWFNNMGKKKKEAQPKVRINVGSSAKRLPSDAQIYTKLYGSKLHSPVQERMAVDDRKYIAVLNEVARDRLEKESEAVKAEIAAEKERLREEKKELKRVEKEMETGKSAQEYTNTERQVAIHALPDAMRVFTSEMGPRTGWTFLLVAGGPNPGDPNGEIETIAYHYGATRTGATFGEMNSAAVNMILEEFSTFNHLVTPYEERVFRALNPSVKSLEAREKFIRERGGAPEVHDTIGLEPIDEDGEVNPTALTVRKSKRSGRKKGKGKDKDKEEGGERKDRNGGQDAGGKEEATKATTGLGCTPNASPHQAPTPDRTSSGFPPEEPSATQQPLEAQPPAVPQQPEPTQPPALPRATEETQPPEPTRPSAIPQAMELTQPPALNTVPLISPHTLWPSFSLSSMVLPTEVPPVVPDAPEFSPFGQLQPVSPFLPTGEVLTQGEPINPYLDTPLEYGTGQGGALPGLAHQMFNAQDYDLGAEGSFGLEVGGGNDGDESDDDRFGGVRLPPYQPFPEKEADIDGLFDREGWLVANGPSALPTYPNPFLEEVRVVGEDDEVEGGKGTEGGTGSGGEAEGEKGVQVANENDARRSAESALEGCGGLVDVPETGVGQKRKRGVQDDGTTEPGVLGRGARGRKVVEREMPAWFEMDMAYLKGDGGCEDWTSCLQAYEEFETHAGVIGMKARRLGGSKFRPTELSKWLSQRRYHSLPELSDLTGFADRWIDWWKEMQPHCRKFGHIDSLPGPVQPHFDLSALRSPGKSGLVTVMIGLKWWAGLGGNDKRWAAMVQDVRECLVHLNRKS